MRLTPQGDGVPPAVPRGTSHSARRIDVATLVGSDRRTPRPEQELRIPSENRTVTPWP
jgi:hypothetical protein